MPWTLKTDENGLTAVQDGKPVYVDENGDEAAFDVNQLHAKVLSLGRENKTRREKAEDANRKLDETLALFEGVEDLPAWRAEALAALETVRNLGDEELVRADKVEALKKSMAESFDDKAKKERAKFDAQIADKETHLTRKEMQIRQLMVSNKFATCSLFSGSDPETTIPPDMAEARFGHHFKVEEKDGTPVLVAYDLDGEVMQSKDRPGETAQFDEAIRIIFDRYPDKDRVLRTSAGGSGAGGGSSAARGKRDELTILKDTLAKTTDPKVRVALKRQLHALEAAKRK